MYNLSEGTDLIKRWNPDPRSNNNLLNKGIPSYDDGGDGVRYDGSMEGDFFKKEARPSLLRKTLGKDEEKIMRGEGVEGFFIEDKNEEDEADSDLEGIELSESPEIGGNFEDLKTDEGQKNKELSIEDNSEDIDFDLEGLELPELPEIGVFTEEIEQPNEEPVVKKVGFWEKVKNFWQEKPLKKMGQKVKEILFYETGDDETKIQKNLDFYKPLEQMAKTVVDKSVAVWNKVKEIYQEKPWRSFGQKVKAIIFDKKEREELIDKCRGYFEARAKKRKELATA